MGPGPTIPERENIVGQVIEFPKRSGASTYGRRHSSPTAQTQIGRLGAIRLDDDIFAFRHEFRHDLREIASFRAALPDDIRQAIDKTLECNLASGLDRVARGFATKVEDESAKSRIAAEFLGTIRERLTDDDARLAAAIYFSSIEDVLKAVRNADVKQILRTAVEEERAGGLSVRPLPA